MNPEVVETLVGLVSMIGACLVLYGMAWAMERKR